MAEAKFQYSVSDALDIASMRPGYMADLHYYDAHKDNCAQCNRPWPCRGAERQIADARRWARPWWFLPWDKTTGLPAHTTEPAKAAPVAAEAEA